MRQTLPSCSSRGTTRTGGLSLQLKLAHHITQADAQLSLAAAQGDKWNTWGQPCAPSWSLVLLAVALAVMLAGRMGRGMEHHSRSQLDCCRYRWHDLTWTGQASLLHTSLLAGSCFC